MLNRPPIMLKEKNVSVLTSKDKDQDSLPIEDSDAISPASSIDQQLPPKIFLATNSKHRRFRKPNSLIHNTPQKTLTATQQKLINVLLSNTQLSERLEENTWMLSLNHLLFYLNIETRNTKHIDKVIDSMSSIKMRWNAMEEKGVAKYYSVIFPDAKFYNGKVIYKVNEKVTEILKQKISYTKLDLLEQAKLSRACTIPLYELAARYVNVGQTQWLDWEFLRDMILSADNIPENAKKWMTFNSKYLTPAIKDINVSTKFNIKIETNRVQRAVKKVKLIIVETTKTKINEEAMGEVRKNLQTKMQVLGVSEFDISKIFKNYAPQEIEGALKHLAWRTQQTKLKPLTAPSRFFKISLKNSYYKDYPCKTASFFNFEPKKEKSNGKGGREKLVDIVQKQRIENVKIILNEINVSELESIYYEYNQGKLALNQIKSKGRNRPGILPAFQAWYANKLWGEITDTEIVEAMGNIFADQLF